MKILLVTVYKRHTFEIRIVHDLLCHPIRSIVVRTSVLASGLSLSCTRLMDGCLTTLWVRYQSTNKANSACHPSGVG